MAREPDAARLPGDDERQLRERLASEFEQVIRDLETDHKVLSQAMPRPRDRIMVFWQRHMDKVSGHIAKLQTKVNQCREIQGKDLERELKNLDVGLKNARVEVQAALRAFQAPNDANQSKEQSQLRMTAIDQLNVLAQLCPAVIAQLRGMGGIH